MQKKKKKTVCPRPLLGVGGQIAVLSTTSGSTEGVALERALHCAHRTCSILLCCFK